MAVSLALEKRHAMYKATLDRLADKLGLKAEVEANFDHPIARITLKR